MVVTRAIAIYGLGRLSNGVANSLIGWREQTVLWWGGLRGSVSIALALSVPITLIERDKIIATVFGVVLFTLLVQGLTIKPLVETLQLLGDGPLRKKYSEMVARQAALARVMERLDQVEKRPEIEPEFYRYQAALVQGQIEQLKEEINQMSQQNPQIRKYAIEELQQELLAIEANTYV